LRNSHSVFFVFPRRTHSASNHFSILNGFDLDGQPMAMPMPRIVNKAVNLTPLGDTRMNFAGPSSQNNLGRAMRRTLAGILWPNRVTGSRLPGIWPLDFGPDTKHLMRRQSDWSRSPDSRWFVTSGMSVFQISTGFGVTRSNNNPQRVAPKIGETACVRF